MLTGMAARRAARWLTGALVVAASMGALSPNASAASASTSELLPGAAVPTSAITALEMFTPQVGVAMAHLPPTAFGRGTYYVVRTGDGGADWQVSGPLPADLTPSQPELLSMAFADPQEGYVSLGTTGMAFTDDGGGTWSTVKVVGSPAALSLAGDSLWVMAYRCPHILSSPSLCSTDLESLKVGQLTPASVKAVPVLGPFRTAHGHPTKVEATFWSRLGDEALVSEGGGAGHTSILVSLNAGSSWRVADDPCGAIPIGGLVQQSRSDWVLYCSLDGGMHQGTNELWATSDTGRRWVLASEGSEEDRPHDVGNIGPGMMGDLTASHNGRVLWMLGSVSGIDVSVNGGVHWVGADVDTGGYPSQIVTVGATDAWLPLPGTGLYETTNGITWTQLGVSSHGSTPACRNGQISVSVASGGAGLGHVAEILLFSNTGPSTCTLSGYPGVAGLSAQGAQVVQAQREPSGYLGGLQQGATPPLVVLAPGQTASAMVEGTDVQVGSTSCISFPALLVTPPGFTTSTKVAVVGYGGNGGGFPGCSRIEVHPVVPGKSGQLS